MSLESEYLDDSVDYFYETEENIYEENVSDVLYNCVVPSLLSVWPVIFKLIGSSLTYGILTSLQLPSEYMYHIIASLSGIFMLTSLESNEAIIIFLGFALLSYPLLWIIDYIEKTTKTKSYNFIIPGIYILTLVLCEHCFFEEEIWLQIRGILMIFSMKLLSFIEVQKHTTVPNILEYFGYTLCGPNIIFGPWFSYQEYQKQFLNPTRKNWRWILGMFRAVVISLLFLTVSNCWTTFLIPDEFPNLLLSYREALSVRTSHYFISYLAEASMLAAGFKNSKIWSDPTKWTYNIVNPVHVEFPNALATVVTNWNLPMHEFLKKHVYKPCLPHGKFIAILTTFIVSSFLHGFALKVSVILLLLGVFSYIQLETRSFLCSAFSVCVKIYPCKECHHDNKRNSYTSMFIRIILSILTVLHLIYVGVLLSPTTDTVGIWEKWNSLGYMSFWIMAFKLALIKM